jgi:hypothetical protein
VEAKRYDDLKGDSTLTERDSVSVTSEGAMRQSYANYATSLVPLPIKDDGASTSAASHPATSAELVRGYAANNPESNGGVPTGYSGFWKEGTSNIAYPEVYGRSSGAPQVQERHIRANYAETVRNIANQC